MSLVDFGKVASIPVPDDLSVDSRDRLYVLSPDIPNFEKLKEIAREGEAVYKGDPFFDRRFGYATINTLGTEGTENKVMLGFGTEDILRATLSIQILAVPETNCIIDHRNAPSNPDLIRAAFPQRITNEDELNFIFPFAVNSLYETRPGQKNEDTKKLGSGAGRREIFTTLRRFGSRYVTDTGTPTPKHNLWLSHNSSWAHDMDKITRSLYYLFYISDAQRKYAQSHLEEDKAELEWGQVAHMAGNGAAVGDLKLDDNDRLVINFSYAHDYRQQYQNGILVFAEHLYEQLSPELKKHAMSAPSTVEIQRTPAQKMPVEELETGLDEAHFGLA